MKKDDKDKMHEGSLESEKNSGTIKRNVGARL